MSAERCRVGIILNDLTQYYQREMETRRDGRWVAIPHFVVNRSESITMSEAVAKALVLRLRSLGALSAWVEDAKDGRRIDVPFENQQPSGEDHRVPVIAKLDDSTEDHWYVVKPICRPEGRKYFLSIAVPGLPDNQVIYGDHPEEVLQRARDLGWLQFAPIYQRPQPQQAAPIYNGPRRRPGDIRNDH